MCSATEEDAEQLQVFRCFCRKEGESGNMGHLWEILLVL